VTRGTDSTRDNLSIAHKGRAHPSSSPLCRHIRRGRGREAGTDQNDPVLEAPDRPNKHTPTLDSGTAELREGRKGERDHTTTSSDQGACAASTTATAALTPVPMSRPAPLHRGMGRSSGAAAVAEVHTREGVGGLGTTEHWWDLGGGGNWVWASETLTKGMSFALPRRASAGMNFRWRVP
jgi:hypothetical protein